MAHLHREGIVAGLNIAGISHRHGHIVEFARFGEVGFGFKSVVERITSVQCIPNMFGGDGVAIHDKVCIKFICGRFSLFAMKARTVSWPRFSPLTGDTTSLITKSHKSLDSSKENDLR